MLTDNVAVCDNVPEVVAVPDDEPPGDDRSVLGLTELLLKDPDRLDRLARDDGRQPLLIPSFLAVGLASFSLFALALGLTFNAAPVAALPGGLARAWAGRPPASAVGRGLGGGP